ncbi:MAG: Zn-ribbon domain-containing OB-fold protein [bacterium]
MEETRQVKGAWDLTTYKWKIDGGGMELLCRGFKDKKVFGVKCRQCGTVYVPGVDYCRKCFIDVSEVVEVSDKGKVTTYTVNLADIRGNPLDVITIPCTVQLDGADSVIMGTIEGIEWEKVYVGMPVRIVWKEETKGALADIDHFEAI